MIPGLWIGVMIVVVVLLVLPSMVFAARWFADRHNRQDGNDAGGKHGDG